MENFKEEIVYDIEKRRTIMEKILLTMLNSPKVLELSELSILKSEDMKYIKKEEFIAIYALALELRKSMPVEAKKNKKLEQYLYYRDGSLNSQNLLKFINYEISDMIELKLNNSHTRWTLSVNKILKEIDKNEGKTKSYKIKE